MCDEVQAGFGRTGTLWGFEHYGIVPDLALFGKGISSSLPLAAVAGRPDVMDLQPAGSMTSTHTGNPVCCAAALASIDLVLRENLAENSRRVGGVLHQKLCALASRTPQIGHVDGKGLVAGMACVVPGTKEPDGGLAWDVVRRAVEKGVLMFSPVGYGGATIKICPPLVITEAAILDSLAAFEEAFAQAVERASRGLMPCPQVLIVGGGMITHDQLLPSLYHLQRQGRIGADRRVRVALRYRARSGARRNAAARLPRPIVPRLARSRRPSPAGPLPRSHRRAAAAPDRGRGGARSASLRSRDGRARPRSARPVRSSRWRSNTRHAVDIEREARARDLLVAVEYHKRFDDRSLMARRQYRAGAFGEFRLGSARLFEKWYYRHSNFQNWMTAEHSDAFTYIGCHYVDLVHFITGLLPVAVSVYGVRDRFPNGNEGFLWTDARVIWNNGACLNVQNGLGFPDDAPGTNTQGLTLYCGGER